jgi:hypothetical protein
MNTKFVITVWITAITTICLSQIVNGHIPPPLQNDAYFKGVRFSISLDSFKMSVNTTNTLHCHIENGSTNLIQCGSPMESICLTNGLGEGYCVLTFDEFSHSVNHFKTMKPGEVYDWTPHFALNMAFDPKTQARVKLKGNYRLCVVHIVNTPNDYKYFEPVISDSFDVVVTE